MGLPASIRLKIAQAKRQIEALEQAEREAFERAPYSLQTYRNPEGTHHWIQLKAREDMTPLWGLIMGEALYHLRTCLDHAVWQLVLDNNRTPTERTGFPLALSERWFKSKGVAKLCGVPPESLAVFESLQPYNTPHYGRKPELEPLWLLNELRNADQHHALHVMLTVPESVDFTLPDIRGIRGDAHHGSMKDGAHIFDFWLPTPMPDMDVNPEATLRIAIQETERTPTLLFPDITGLIVGAVTDSLTKLEPFFA